MVKRDYFLKVIVCAIVIALLLLSTVTAAAATVKFYGHIEYECDLGTVRVGKYEVDGEIAFCIEHIKASPETGTSMDSYVYDDDLVQKILYYGWGGPEQWEGFTDEEEGIVATSLYLSEVYTDDYEVGHYDHIANIAAFKEYVENAPQPSLDLSFSADSLEAYYDEEGQYERTEDITVLGGEVGTIELVIPDGYVLVMSETGDEYTGTVSLAAGDVFYIRTEGIASSEKRTIIEGTNPVLQTIVFVSSNSSYQKLANLQIVQDSSSVDMLEIEWPGKEVYFKVNKTGEVHVIANGKIESTIEPLEGVTFEVKAAEKIIEYGGTEVVYEYGDLVATLVTDEDGVAATDALPPGRYYVVEVASADGYILDSTVRMYNLTVPDDQHEAIFEVDYINYLPDTEFTLIKKDAYTDELLSGAVFVIENEDGETLEITTDDTGTVTLLDVPEGIYLCTEIEAPDGYLIMDMQYQFIIDYSDEETLSVEIIVYNESESIEVASTPETSDPFYTEGLMFYVVVAASAGLLLVVIVLAGQLRRRI